MEHQTILETDRDVRHLPPELHPDPRFTREGSGKQTSVARARVPAELGNAPRQRSGRERLARQQNGRNASETLSAGGPVGGKIRRSLRARYRRSALPPEPLHFLETHFPTAHYDRVRWSGA